MKALVIVISLMIFGLSHSQNYQYLNRYHRPQSRHPVSWRAPSANYQTSNHQNHLVLASPQEGFQGRNVFAASTDKTVTAKYNDDNIVFQTENNFLPQSHQSNSFQSLYQQPTHLQTSQNQAYIQPQHRYVEAKSQPLFTPEVPRNKYQPAASSGQYKNFFEDLEEERKEQLKEKQKKEEDKQKSKFEDLSLISHRFNAGTGTGNTATSNVNVHSNGQGYNIQFSFP